MTVDPFPRCSLTLRTLPHSFSSRPPSSPHTRFSHLPLIRAACCVAAPRAQLAACRVASPHCVFSGPRAHSTVASPGEVVAVFECVLRCANGVGFQGFPSGSIACFSLLLCTYLHRTLRKTDGYLAKFQCTRKPCFDALLPAVIGEFSETFCYISTTFIEEYRLLQAMKTLKLAKLGFSQYTRETIRKTGK